MKLLILTLIFAVAATCGAPAANDRNIGLLLEWIQVDHKTANQLLHLSAGEKNATALREVLEAELDAGKATLVETSYLVSSPGVRARVESLREHLYATEFDPERLLTLGVPGKREMSSFPKQSVSPSALGIPLSVAAFDTRDLGTSVEIEPNIGRDGSLDFLIETTRTEHLGDRLVGDPVFALNGAEQPTFRELKTSLAFTASDGEDILIDVLTPKNGSDQRLFLIVRANILRANPTPAADQIGFSKLPAGSTLTVDFHSSGCFHNTASRYEFTGNQVTISQLEPTLAKHGTVKLSDADLEKLDKTLAFYRDSPAGGCTTVEEISFKLREGGRAIAHEKYIDGSCTIDEQKGLLRFGELNLRLK